MKFLDVIRSRLFGCKDPTGLSSREFGTWAEKQAERYLRRQGLKPLARNYHTGRGEVDLIMRQGETLVFVEVKAVRNPDTDPELKINNQKRHRIITAAKCFLAAHKCDQNPARFDIVTVKLDSHNKPCVEHEPDAFHAEY